MHVSAYPNIHLSICLCVQQYTSVDTPVCIYAYTRRTDGSMYVYIHTSVYTYVDLFASVAAYIYMAMWSMYTYTCPFVYVHF